MRRIAMELADTDSGRGHVADLISSHTTHRRGFADQRLIREFDFPDQREEFPVLIARELGERRSNGEGSQGAETVKRPWINEIPCFSPIIREFGTENGSQQTAPSATEPSMSHILCGGSGAVTQIGIRSRFRRYPGGDIHDQTFRVPPPRSLRSPKGRG